MKYIECPKVYKGKKKSLFLAGGITNCYNWQHEFTKMLQDTNLVVLNPRRKYFPINNPNATIPQTRWEYNHLNKSTGVSFWFSPETLCPITLYELGKQSARDKPVFVGVHPDYARKQDVITQTSLIRPEIQIVSSLDELANQVKEWKIPERKYPTFQEYLKAKYQGPFMATDILIRYTQNNKSGIVMIERKFFPHGLAFPGGMAEYMTLENNAIKEAKEETGLNIILDSPNQPLCVMSNPTQDPRAFIASAAYTAQGYGILKPHKDEDAKNARVFNTRELENLVKHPEKLAFPDHHKKILEFYLASLR